MHLHHPCTCTPMLYRMLIRRQRMIYSPRYLHTQYWWVIGLVSDGMVIGAAAWHWWVSCTHPSVGAYQRPSQSSFETHPHHWYRTLYGAVGADRRGRSRHNLKICHSIGHEEHPLILYIHVNIPGYPQGTIR